MRLTTEQLAALDSSGNSLIVACPGSGKTRTLMAKMLQCIDEVRGTPHKIATLTYTNAAVHEIEFRLWRDGSEGDSKYCHIATIHSFCLSNIIQQFYVDFELTHCGLDSFVLGRFLILPQLLQFRRYFLKDEYHLR